MKITDADGDLKKIISTVMWWRPWRWKIIGQSDGSFGSVWCTQDLAPTLSNLCGDALLGTSCAHVCNSGPNFSLSPQP